MADESRNNEAKHDQSGTMLSNLPLWARTITFVGIPGAIALYLVYIMSQTLPSILLGVEVLKQEAIKGREISQEQLAKQQDMYRLQQRICSNTAKDTLERGQCFDLK